MNFQDLHRLCRKFCTAFLLVLSLPAQFLYAQKSFVGLAQIVDTAYAAHPNTTGIMVSIVGADGRAWEYATGIADRATGKKLQANQPVLTASNTKTYVSAAILRLCEMRKLRLDDTIGAHLSATTLRKLRDDGYETGRIKLTHLLSHTSGIDDYVNDEYFDFVNNNRRYRWTRDEQIERAMRVGKPLSLPEDTFRYADVNYLLLTEMIERKTGQPFYKALRTLLNYDQQQLKAIWFTTLEPMPKGTAALAHQYWSKRGWDAYDFDPSWDLYGGGGIAATPADMAMFFKALFEGKIVKDTNVLSRMYQPVPSKTPTNYCLGIRRLNIAGLTGYYHGGFWGTDVLYFPALKTAMCIVVLEKSEKDLSAGICKAIAERLKEAQGIK